MTLTPQGIPESDDNASFGSSLHRGGIWLLIQLSPLILMLLHVPLWARGPEPREALLPISLLTCQMVGSAVLFPWLLRQRGLFAFLLGTAMVFQLLATIAAEQTLTSWIAHSAIIGGWILFLTILARRIDSPPILAGCCGALSMIALLTPFIAPI